MNPPTVFLYESKMVSGKWTGDFTAHSNHQTGSFKLRGDKLSKWEAQLFHFNRRLECYSNEISMFQFSSGLESHFQSFFLNLSYLSFSLFKTSLEHETKNESVPSTCRARQPLSHSFVIFSWWRSECSSLQRKCDFEAPKPAKNPPNGFFCRFVLGRFWKETLNNFFVVQGSNSPGRMIQVPNMSD